MERGLLGPREPVRIWERHLLNSAVLAELVPWPRGRLADLGSGAGLPGIVLAIMLPRARVVLIEAMERRAAFLAECVSELGLGNVEVQRARGEDLAGRVGADVVTARAVAPLERMAAIAAGLARPGGLVLAVKGAGAAGELARAGPVLRRLGVVGAQVVTAGAGVVSEPATVVRFGVPAARGGGSPPRRRGSPGAREGATGAGAGARRAAAGGRPRRGTGLP